MTKARKNVAYFTVGFIKPTDAPRVREGFQYPLHNAIDARPVFDKDTGDCTMGVKGFGLMKMDLENRLYLGISLTPLSSYGGRIRRKFVYLEFCPYGTIFVKSPNTATTCKKMKSKGY